TYTERLQPRKQLSRRNAQSLGQGFYCEQGGISFSQLNTTYVSAIEATQVGEGFLGKAVCSSQVANTLAECNGERTVFHPRFIRQCCLIDHGLNVTSQKSAYHFM
ncbi:hypothetical protein, partial [Pseudomonas indica]|uniref:hypothetical protein n=1 Tax=Pseudomonas indica TaxID=137658 RepID=UPI003F639AB8